MCNKQIISDTLYLTSQYPRIDELITQGGRLNKKDGLTRYGDSHVKDETS